MLFKPALAGRAKPLFPLLLALLIALGSGPVAHGQAGGGVGTVTGLKLPRFVSTRSDEINVRVGPGTKYDIAWNFVAAGQPVEIIQEFDTWRKIRDVDGDEGWIHQGLLVGNRVGFATPLAANGEVHLMASRAEDAGIRARLGAGFKVAIRSCDGEWCEVSANRPAERISFSGFVRQEELWGVYPGEVFD